MDDEQLLRYSRQIMLPQVDIVGQEKLLNATVLIIGLGGLGSPVSMYLASAGVGHLLLCDFDTVDLSNLQRQIVHGSQDIGKLKVESARDSLLALNPHTHISILNHTLSTSELNQAVAAADVVVDCCDNLETRLMISEACYKALKPLVSGAAIRLEGQVSVYLNRDPQAPCYRCLYPGAQMPSETCTQSGVLGPLLGIIGSIQALETLKILIDIGTTLDSRLLLLDALHMEWHEVKLVKSPQCPVCHQPRETGSGC